MNNEEPHKCIDTDELLRDTARNIEKFGLQVIMVNETGYLPDFAYSVGLWPTYNHPEIICLGLPNDLAHSIINDVAEIIKQGNVFEADKTYSEIFKDSKAGFLNVAPENIKYYFRVAMRHYSDEEFPAIQLVWTDRNNRFPWETDFEEKFRYDQPLLDRNTDFKFREPKNLTTFTTWQWLDLKSTILRVVHDNEGEWQFLTGDQMPEDIRIVALEQLTLSDKTLNDVFDLEIGEAADRNFVGDEWVRSKTEDNEDEE